MPYDDLLTGRYSETYRIYFVTCVLANRSLRFFEDFALARVVVEEMKALHDNGDAAFLAWVVMPDHWHGLLQLQESMSLSMLMQSLKGRSARRINILRRTTGTVWQKGFYDHALRKEEDARSIARYIVANPLRGGLVDGIGDYPHWDACWL